MARYRDELDAMSALQVEEALRARPRRERDDPTDVYHDGNYRDDGDLPWLDGSDDHEDEL